MARPDRWERQLTLDVNIDPALLSAQDAAADSLMGNRAQRQAMQQEKVKASTLVSEQSETTATPNEEMAVQTTVQTAVVNEMINETEALHPAPSTEESDIDDEDARALRIASGLEESTAPKREYDDRRGRRSPYRRRGPRRPSNVRREHNNEKAAEFSAPTNEPH
jgi:hypothetical protein